MKTGAEYEALFVDWLSIWQVHPAHAPINSGSIVTFDGSGHSVFERSRPAFIQGSYSTSCSVKSDGSCVVFSGNFGRLNRQDNLFGFDPSKTLERANLVAKYAGLPPFRVESAGDHASVSGIEPASIGNSGRDFEQDRTRYEFVNLSRVDLTKNYTCGSVAAARAVVRAISGKAKNRLKKGVAGDSSVWWSNTRHMIKVYVKALEMEAHGTNTGRAYEYARDNGIIRLEVELKRRELHDLGWNNYAEFIKAWDMGKVHQLFADYEKVMTVEKHSNDVDFIASLPQKLQVVASAFLSGRDIKAMLKKTTFFKYRKALLEYGIDISDDSPAQIDVAVRHYEVQEVCAPEWYWKDQA